MQFQSNGLLSHYAEFGKPILHYLVIHIHWKPAPKHPGMVSDPTWTGNCHLNISHLCVYHTVWCMQLQGPSHIVSVVLLWSSISKNIPRSIDVTDWSCAARCECWRTFINLLQMQKVINKSLVAALRVHVYQRWNDDNFLGEISFLDPPLSLLPPAVMIDFPLWQFQLVFIGHPLLFLFVSYPRNGGDFFPKTSP